MRLRLSLLSLLVVSGVTLAGCTGARGGAAASATTPTTERTTTTPTETTSDEPQKGDNLLSLSEVGDETAMDADAGERANFSALDSTQRDAFLRAYNCSCTVAQETFRYNDHGRIEYVRYEGQWYYLRVAIV
ncbi:MAG: hypothetical protein ABEJ22_01025 [Haloferacaceae archaeon]